MRSAPLIALFEFVTPLLATAAAVGFVLAVAVHVASIADQSIPLVAVLLLPGVFGILFPTIVRSLSRGQPIGRGGVRVSFRGCPGWMRFIAQASLSYGLIAFLIGFARMVSSSNEEWDWTSTSAILIGFYAIGGAALYSLWKTDPAVSRCPDGHQVTAGATTCQVCGKSLQDRIEERDETR